MKDSVPPRTNNSKLQIKSRYKLAPALQEQSMGSSYGEFMLVSLLIGTRAEFFLVKSLLHHRIS